jgi:hypothetical protein
MNAVNATTTAADRGCVAAPGMARGIPGMRRVAFTMFAPAMVLS